MPMPMPRPSVRRWPRVALALLGAGALATPSEAHAAPPVVAVFDIQNDGTALAPKELERLGDYLAVRVAEGRRFQVVPKAQLKQALSQKKQESYAACYAESCQIEIGKEVAAQQTLASKVQRFGNTCIFSVTLFDLRSAASEGAGSAKGGCGLNDVLESMEKAVAQLTEAAPRHGAPERPKVAEVRSVAEPPRDTQATKSPEQPRSQAVEPVAPEEKSTQPDERAVKGGGLSRGEISRAIGRSQQRFRYCYEVGLSANPSLAGRVVVGFVVGLQGKVTSAEVVETTLRHPGVEACLSRVMRTVTFPRPSGAPVTVRYPFVFAPSS